MRLLGLLLVLQTGMCMAGELPPSPSHALRHPAETYAPDERLIVHNAPPHVNARYATDFRGHEKPYNILDGSFWAVHGLYAGALSFDLLETSRGVSHGCAEANTDLGSYPSNGHLVANGLIEFGAVLAGDAFLKIIARHNHMSHWPAVALGSIGAGIGAGKHIHGAYLWTQTGCI